MVLRFLQSRQRYSYNGIDHIPVRLRKNYCSTSELRWPARLGLWENTMQDAQKGQTSHPPNPGAPRRALSQARRSERRGEEVHTALRVGRSPLLWVLANGKAPTAFPTSEKLLLNVEPLSAARTKLADFFSILLWSSGAVQPVRQRSDPAPGPYQQFWPASGQRRARCRLFVRSSLIRSA